MGEITLSKRLRGYPVDVRFWSKVNASGVCWEWTGSLTEGYGKFYVDQDRGLRKAHRFAYELLIGKIPVGKELDHLCRNTSCVNPDHLEPVAHRLNVLRGGAAAAANARRTHCKNGHEFTPENTALEANGAGTRRRCRACRRARRRDGGGL